MTGKMILGIVLLVPGIVLAGWSAWVMYRDSRPGKWPSERAEIVSSQAVEGEDGKGFRFRVEYTYEVDGTTYTSYRHTPREKSLPEDEAKRLVERHPAGKPTLAHYNPADPTIAYLETPFPTWTVYVLILALILAINGAVLLKG